MGSFLDKMAGSIYAGFKGKLRKGVIRVPGAVTGKDAKNRPERDPPALVPFEGFEDDYSDFTRAQAGIPKTSVRLNIFGASIATPGIKPTTDQLCRLDFPAANGQAAYVRWYKLRTRINIDPAGALWQCEAEVVEAPPDGG